MPARRRGVRAESPAWGSGLPSRGRPCGGLRDEDIHAIEYGMTPGFVPSSTSPTSTGQTRSTAAGPSASVMSRASRYLGPAHPLGHAQRLRLAADGGIVLRRRRTARCLTIRAPGTFGLAGLPARGKHEPVDNHRTAANLLRSPAAYRLSGALGVVALVASSTSFFIPGVLGGPAVSQGNLRGTALVIMVIAVPVLFASMYFASRDSARALVVWLGAVGYIIYQGVLFLFGTPFNSLFLIYVAMLSLALWSAVLLVWRIDLTAFRARFDAKLPARGIAIYAVAVAALNALVWLRTIVPAMLSDSPSAFLEGSGMITNPVFVQDLAVWLPLLSVAAWWLWKRRPWGELIIGAMLVLLVLESIGVATDQWFGAIADPDTPFASMAAVPLFLGLAIIGAVPLFFYFRHLHAEGAPAGRRAQPDRRTT